MRPDVLSVTGLSESLSARCGQAEGSAQSFFTQNTFFSLLLLLLIAQAVHEVKTIRRKCGMPISVCSLTQCIITEYECRVSDLLQCK